MSVDWWTAPQLSPSMPAGGVCWRPLSLTTELSDLLYWFTRYIQSLAMQVRSKYLLDGRIDARSAHAPWGSLSFRCSLVSRLHVSVSLSVCSVPLRPLLFLIIILLSLFLNISHTQPHTQTDIPSVFPQSVVLNSLFFSFLFWPKFYFFNSFIKIYFLYRVIHPNKV